jgi:hypothetical protein
MGESKLPILSGAESQKLAAHKFTLVQPAKLEQEEMYLSLRTIPQAFLAMDVEQQPGAAQFVPDDVEIIKFESTAVSDWSAC